MAMRKHRKQNVRIGKKCHAQLGTGSYAVLLEQHVNRGIEVSGRCLEAIN